jgi:hypothetical protein
LIAAIYQAREGPDGGATSILPHHQEALENLRKACVAMSDSPHKKTRELGREFLNDWETIFRVLEYPAWPLTNNEAERALRHWVILRKITQGTRSDQGSRALALFASVLLPADYETVRHCYIFGMLSIYVAKAMMFLNYLRCWWLVKLNLCRGLNGYPNNKGTECRQDTSS